MTNVYNALNINNIIQTYNVTTVSSSTYVINLSSANYLLNIYACSPPSGGLTITLPAISPSKQMSIKICDNSGQSNTRSININTSGGNTIKWSNNLILNNQYGCYQLTSDLNSRWIVG